MVAKHEFDWKNVTILDDNDLDDNFFHGKKRLFVSISKVMYLLILDSEFWIFFLSLEYYCSSLYRFTLCG